MRAFCSCLGRSAVICQACARSGCASASTPHTCLPAVAVLLHTGTELPSAATLAVRGCCVVLGDVCIWRVSCCMGRVSRVPTHILPLHHNVSPAALRQCSWLRQPLPSVLQDIGWLLLSNRFLKHACQRLPCCFQDIIYLHPKPQP